MGGTGKTLRPALTEAHLWEIEHHLQKVKREEAGNFPLIQALETVLAHGSDRPALTEAQRPTYNHTREDSPLTPCPLCAALAEIARLREGLPNLEETLLWYRDRAINAESELELAHDDARRAAFDEASAEFHQYDSVRHPIDRLVTLRDRKV